MQMKPPCKADARYFFTHLSRFPTTLFSLCVSSLWLCWKLNFMTLHLTEQTETQRRAVVSLNNMYSACWQRWLAFGESDRNVSWFFGLHILMCEGKGVKAMDKGERLQERNLSFGCTRPRSADPIMSHLNRNKRPRRCHIEFPLAVTWLCGLAGC